MRKLTFLILGLIILGLVGYGYWQAADKEDREDGGARIVVEPEKWDFGEIEFGKVVEKEFSLKNEGNEILEISRVSTSCGCTRAEVDKEKLEPGEEGKLLVTYDTGAMSGVHGKGRQERIVYLKTNDFNNPQMEVFIYALVK